MEKTIVVNDREIKLNVTQDGDRFSWWIFVMKGEAWRAIEKRGGFLSENDAKAAGERALSYYASKA